MHILTASLVALANSYASAEEAYREVNDEGVPTFSNRAAPQRRTYNHTYTQHINRYDVPTKSINTAK